MATTLESWQTAVDLQARAFLVGAREANALFRDGGRIIAIIYAPGGRFGSWQPWVAMGAAKSAMECLCRYFAVALARRKITVNGMGPLNLQYPKVSAAKREDLDAEKEVALPVSA
jgi:enoyl-[acyl-carrier-protein] reductase (NADH)